MTKIEKFAELMEWVTALQNDELSPEDRSAAYQICGPWAGGWDTVYRTAIEALPELKALLEKERGGES